MLDFWKNDFETSVGKHIDYLKSNLENQNNYSSKFSEILKKMDIFQNEDDETKEENQEDGQNNPSNDDQQSESEEKKIKIKNKKLKQA